MRHRSTALLLAVAAALAVGLVASLPALAAGGGMMGTPTPSPSSSTTPSSTPSPSPASVDGTWCAGGFWNGSGTWGGTGMWGTAFGANWLRSHPHAFSAWLKLRTGNMTEMRTWFDQYQGDPTSSAAQQALQTLWQDHWDVMKTFYQRYADGTTWVAPSLTMWRGMMGSGGMMSGGEMWGTGYGADWLMGHPTGFASWMTLRTQQMSQVRTWWAKHHAHPFSLAAKRTLATMRAHHKAQDLAFMTRNDVTTGTAWSYRGWMGMGGSWGGFGW